MSQVIPVVRVMPMPLNVMEVAFEQYNIRSICERETGKNRLPVTKPSLPPPPSSRSFGGGDINRFDLLLPDGDALEA